jgi:hypothetical protein
MIVLYMYIIYLYHKVHIYKEYHSVCPLVGIGALPSPNPSLASECAPPPQNRGGGGGTLAWGCVFGVGQFPTT